MPQATSWDPNRYGSVKHVLKFDSATGTWSTEEQRQSYNATYNFTPLPTPSTTTSSSTTNQQQTSTTQQQTSEAFGNVKPYYWEDNNNDSPNVFTIPKDEESSSSKRTFIDDLSDKFKRAVTPKSYYEYKGDFEQDEGTIYPDPNKKKQTMGGLKPFAHRIIKAITNRPTILGSSPNRSYRGVAGLYSKEINLMNTYGSTRPTDGNPTGDPRKDDAGFNIISGAGNYNKIGTYSRRHNMLKEADKKYEKNSKEWKDERNKIRNDWEAENNTGVENRNYDIDSSGSKPSAPTGIKGPAGQEPSGPKGDGGAGVSSNNAGSGGGAGQDDPTAEWGDDPW